MSLRFLLFILASFWCRTLLSQIGLYGSISGAYSSSIKGFGPGLHIGVIHKSSSRWVKSFEIQSAWTEAKGAFSPQPRELYTIKDYTFSNPLFNLFDERQLRGIRYFSIYPDKYYRFGINFRTGYSYNTQKNLFSAEVGVGLNYNYLTKVVYVLRGAIDPYIGPFIAEALMPVFCYQRYIDIAAVVPLTYQRMLGSKTAFYWQIQPAWSLPSNTILLTSGIGIILYLIDK